MDRYSFFRMLGKAVYRIDGAYDSISKKAGVKPSILWLLSALNDGEKHTQSQICWDWNYPRTTVNTLVKELEQQGHVVLRPVAGTRRELYLELTEQGKRYADGLLRQVYEAEEELFRLYFQDRDPQFVRELCEFSDAMKTFFLTGSISQEEPGSER